MGKCKLVKNDSGMWEQAELLDGGWYARCRVGFITLDTIAETAPLPEGWVRGAPSDPGDYHLARAVNGIPDVVTCRWPTDHFIHYRDTEIIAHKRIPDEEFPVWMLEGEA